MALSVIIMYDISDDDIRARVAAMVQRWGDRIQLSVFLCRIDPDELADLLNRIEAIIEHDSDSVYCVTQCSQCWSAVRLIGQAHPPEKVHYYTCW